MGTAYVLDKTDRIVAVGGDWDAFARENGGESACAAAVTGARLKDWIADDPTRMFMTAILMRVRASGQPETVPYRCDSDRVKRFFEMTLTPLPGGLVRVEHRSVGEEAGRVAIRVRPAAGRIGVLRCSICCRLREDDGWSDPFDGPADRTVRVIHTVCPDCRAAPMRAVRARRAGAART